METPNKMIGGIAGAMAGALGGATNLGVQPQQGTASVGPQQPPSVFKPNAVSATQEMCGQNIAGTTNNIMSNNR